jgi:hypothetical protein
LSKVCEIAVTCALAVAILTPGEEDLDDAEGGIRIRLDVFDVVDRRRQRALERRDDAPGHLIRRQPGPGTARPRR